MKKVLIILALVAFPAIPQTRKSQPLAVSLSSPMDWHPTSRRLFTDDPRAFLASLATSWIPGENRRGYLRFKVEISIAELEANKDVAQTQLLSTSAFLHRARSCEFFLRFLDPDGFLLRTVSLTINNSLNDDLSIASLTANDSVQMDASEYRTLIGPPSGSWELATRCYNKLP
jgi:hypothetical protein